LSPKPAANDVSDLTALSGLAPELALSLVTVGSDVALVLDADGVVTNVAFGGADPPVEAAKDWVGRAWADTVTAETRAKVADLLRDVAEHGTSRQRQLNHPSASGRDIPIGYSAVRLGIGGPVLVVGRDLRALSSIQQRFVETQQAMERDSWQMRQAETRYRLLFQIATDAVLVVDATTLKIVDANAAAAKLFGVASDKLVGKAATASLDAVSHPAIEEMLAAARITGRASEIRVRLADDKTDVRMSATPFRAEGATLLLVRARAMGAAANSGDSGTLCAALVERTPDAVVITDADGVVLSANAAFLDLSQLPNEAQARGRPLGDWVGRPGSDIAMIVALVRKHGVARPLSTSVRSEHGPEIETEISAAMLPDDGRERIGFIMRNVERRSAAGPQGAIDLSTAVVQLTGLVGRVSLPDLVRDTTDLVERHYIKAALELTGDNRTTAAEVLGVSRQSLYVKLRRHNLQSGDVAEDDAAQNAAD
jgi:transcriptional regulator PpsR